MSKLPSNGMEKTRPFVSACRYVVVKRQFQNDFGVIWRADFLVLFRVISVYCKKGLTRNLSREFGCRQISIPACQIAVSMTDVGQLQHKDSTAERKLVRCPYCVESGEFKVMEPRDRANGWYMCHRCGHLVMPDNPEFQCSCAKCAGLASQTHLRSR